MTDEKEYLTKDKFKELEDELDYLKRTKRREVADNLEYAKSLGDLKENAEYQEARSVQVTTEDRVNKLESILKSAIIITSHHGNLVDVGATVTIQKESDKVESTYILVGSEETDIANKKISNHSPLGLSLVGKKKGDVFTFSSPSGKITYKVIDVK